MPLRPLIQIAAVSSACCLLRTATIINAVFLERCTSKINNPLLCCLSFALFIKVLRLYVKKELIESPSHLSR